jgi:succinyl-diaminopimelate desuccinylase
MATPPTDLARRAADAVDAKGVVALAQELVRLRSVYEPDKGRTEAEAAHLLAGVLQEMGLTVTVEEAAPGRPNVIADWQGSGYRPGSRTLLFEGHSDVVTEGDAESWSHPPFAGVIEGGRLYGRGAADMKAGVAAAVMALQAVMTAAPELPGRVRLGVVADEEGMMLGIKHFIRRGWADEVDAAIVCEPEELELCLWQKGAMRVAARFTGRMAHGAMPYAGVNPVPWLADFVQGVRALEAAEQARVGAHPQLGLPWLTPTVLRAPATGEAQLNVLPGDAELLLDIRTVPGQEHEAVFAALEGIAGAVRARDARARISLELLEARPWTETSPHEPVVAALEQACRLLGREPRYGGVPGATDGTFLHAWAGVPIVTVGPGERTVPHQRDEWVALDDIVHAAKLYAAAAVLFMSEEKSTTS